MTIETRAHARTAGDTSAFNDAWREIAENARYHFVADAPANQVQFAFQNHWRVFADVVGDVEPGSRAIEVGCGRGSMAAFFAQHGCDTFLLDTSPAALEAARANFALDGLEGHPVCGDALKLPFPDDSFQFIVSIGLLEHFEDIESAVREQMRVVKPGGYFLGYVVPERPVSVQLLAAPFNWLMAFAVGLARFVRGRHARHAAGKPDLYRNSFDSGAYLAILETLGADEKGAFGMFPVPLVSHSPAFPFSTMSPALERLLVECWRRVMAVRRALFRKDPWTCRESWGLAFLVWARKP